MKFDIARQPLVPAFLTLAALAVAAMWNAGAPPPAALQTARDASAGALAVSLPSELLTQFQAAHPGLARWIGGLLILFTGMSLGRLSVRYNLYSANTCLAIPLFAAVACGAAAGSDYLTAFAAAALVALVLKNYCRSFCNGFGFDGIFRASLYLGLLPLVSPAALPLVLLLPLTVMLFRRTLREAAVACAGLLLPVLAVCYVNWGAGGAFAAPLAEVWHAFAGGTPLALFGSVARQQLVFMGGVLLLDLLALFVFLSDMYAVGTKSRLILVYHFIVLLLTAALLCGPAATRGTAALTALPSAVVLPFLFVRIHRALALVLYPLLLASAVLGAVLQ